MAKTFSQMVKEARDEVGVISPQEAQRRLQANPDAMILDVRQTEDRADGKIPGSHDVPLGVLPIKADTELAENLRDPELQDRDREVIVTCGVGGQGALGAKTLHDMGFKNVKILDGGARGWKNAGLPAQ